MEWKPVNSKLIKIRLRGKQINTTIVQCYTPSNHSDEEVKDSFYEQLPAELEEIPRHNMKIGMEDMNAKVGRDNTDYERAMGREGCGAINENGERAGRTLHHLRPRRRGDTLSTQRHSQADLVLSQWKG